MEHQPVFFLSHLAERFSYYANSMPPTDFLWLSIGLIGQCLFMTRFIVQWVHSERHQQSLIPVSFWYLSLSGGLIVLAYGFHRADPVIILGQLPGTFVYTRNLMLIRQKKQLAASHTEISTDSTLS
ncbi:MAG: lipid-A-disaccharide synthase N-terminal domain-containing protein [Methylophilaceae bacterium]|nr:lipid-A-disaccharide synthase N-terminal domain-containing protein [Methylophilaceae bacterium]